jgi:hypothetical protein
MPVLVIAGSSFNGYLFPRLDRDCGLDDLRSDGFFVLDESKGRECCAVVGSNASLLSPGYALRPGKVSAQGMGGCPPMRTATRGNLLLLAALNERGIVGLFGRSATPIFRRASGELSDVLDAGEELSHDGAVAVLCLDIHESEAALWYRLSMAETIHRFLEEAKSVVWGRVRGSPLLALECDERMASLLARLADYEHPGGRATAAARRLAFVLGSYDRRCRDQWLREGIEPIFVEKPSSLRGADEYGEGRLDWLLFASSVFTAARALDEDEVFLVATSSAKLRRGADLLRIAKSLPRAIGWLVGYQKHEREREHALRPPAYFYPTGVMVTSPLLDAWDTWTSGCEVFLATLQLLRVLFAATMQLHYSLPQSELFNCLN